MKKNKQAKSDKLQTRDSASKGGKSAQSSKKAKGVNKSLMYGLLGLSLFLSLIAYIPSMKGEFVNWDDGDYVASNDNIRSLSNMKQILTVPVQGNYHPLTMLSLALNYSISGEETTSYHVVNVLFHLLNIALVFFFVWRLSSKNLIISFAAALLFGVHPMHVESVAWVTERKDVLYTFFFLLGLIAYLKYTDENKKSQYLLSIFFFLLSLTSKPAAIIFPVALFTIDYFRTRKFSMSLILEKVPYFIFSAVLTYLTLNAQKTVGATDKAEAFTLFNRFFFMFYGYMMYVLKMIFPVNLAAFYPLPAVNETLPPEYFVAPLFFIATVALCFLVRKSYPIVVWGFAFYLVNLALVLQFKVIGSAIIADRYTYVPYIGLFVVIGWLVDKMFANKQSTSIAVLSVVGVVLTAVSFQQAATWKNSAALWDNAIEKVPSERAYVNRASMLRKEGKPDKALEYYNKGMQLNKVDPEAYCNRANIYFDKGMDSLALLDYNQALSLRPDFVSALDNRGAMFARAGKSELALLDLNRAIELKPDYKSAYANRAVTFLDMKRYDEAIRDFEKYLSWFPNEIDNRNSMGVCYQLVNKQDMAVKTFTDCISINPKPMFFLNRAYSYAALGKMDLAKADAQRAMQGGMKPQPSFLQKIGLQ